MVMMVLSTTKQVTVMETEANNKNKFISMEEKVVKFDRNHNKSLTFVTEFLMEEFEKQLNKKEADHRVVATDEELQAYYYLGTPYSPENVKFDDNKDNREPTMATACSSTSSSRTSGNLDSTTTTATDNDHGFFLDYITIPRRKRSVCNDLGWVAAISCIQERRVAHHHHHLNPHEQQNLQMNKKRKERRSLSPHPVLHKKLKQTKTNNATTIINNEDSLPAEEEGEGEGGGVEAEPEPEPEPEMPVHMRDSITRLGGTPPVWVAEKKLTVSDLKRSLNRLFIPRNTPLVTFMTKKEKASYSKGKNLVPLIHPSGNQREIHFKFWPSLNQPVFNSVTWYNFVHEYKLKPRSDTVQLWCFRLSAERGSKLCFAMNLIRKQPSLDISLPKHR